MVESLVKSIRDEECWFSEATCGWCGTVGVVTSRICNRKPVLFSIESCVVLLNKWGCWGTVTNSLGPAMSETLDHYIRLCIGFSMKEFHSTVLYHSRANEWSCGVSLTCSFCSVDCKVYAFPHKFELARRVRRSVRRMQSQCNTELNIDIESVSRIGVVVLRCGVES